MARRRDVSEGGDVQLPGDGGIRDWVNHERGLPTEPGEETPNEKVVPPPMEFPPGEGGAEPISRGGEGPRERLPNEGGPGVPGAPPNSPQASPQRPSTPTPMAGSVSPGSGGAQSGMTSQLIPFTPMAPPNSQQSIGGSATPRLRGLFGGSGGLTGGGLGVPQDPISNQLSDPISMLIQQLMRSGGV